MLFNSYIFILFFLPACLTGYYIFNHYKLYKLGTFFLLGMSLWFYGYFNPKYLILICGSIVFNYAIYKYMYMILEKRRTQKIRKYILTIGICCNLGVLGYFKYMNFFVENLNLIFKAGFNLKNIILPLGISFFTFQQISFIVDSYKMSGGGYKYSLLEYSAYVTFFPQLVAGPIVTHDVLVPQLQDETRKHCNWNYMAKGITLFTLGLVKKVLLADVFGNAVNYAFDHIELLNSTTAVIAIFSYTIQIYFDFSGYSDMAIGLGWMMNIDLPINFDSPYKSLTVTEFWKKWHMTLTSFFTMYLYIPLGGNRKGLGRTCINIFLVFLLSGLWHGAGWTFILWGAMHGIAQIVERLLRAQWDKMHPVFSWILSFGFINLTWVFFRADGISEALRIINRVACMDFGSIDKEIVSVFAQPEWRFLGDFVPKLLSSYPNFIMLVYYLLAFVIILGMPNAKSIAENHIQNRIAPIAVAICLTWCLFSFGGVSTFLYFNF